MAFSKISQGWIHELARGETHPEMDRLIANSKASEPQQLVEESTIEFMTALREFLTDFARVFNGFSEGGSKFNDIKIYSLAQTAADFMIFRNQVKLVFANTAHGVIQISFAKHHAPAYGQSEGSETSRPQELIAELGPFRNVSWTFQGEKVQAEEVAKFCFGEFVRATREQKKSSRIGNQQLLEEIKSLLQEKGIDL